VPFVINNDGTLSKNAAEVLFASLVEAEKSEPLEDEIFVLELGIGVGLFARYFLDNFRDLCQRNKKDYYDRLCYIAADRSRRMLLDVLRHGVLANHPGRFRVREVDALEPERLLRDLMFVGQPFQPDGEGQGDGNGRVLSADPGKQATKPGSAGEVRLESLTYVKLRAVFLNYLLDCLPAAVL